MVLSPSANSCLVHDSLHPTLPISRLCLQLFSNADVLCAMKHTLQLLFCAIAMRALAQDAVTLVDCPMFYTANASDSLPARTLAAGTGLHVTGVSSVETIADDEGRVFHWFHVQDAQGKDGWVRGYELATTWATEGLPESIKQINATELALHRDFGVSRLWFAAIKTIDTGNRDAEQLAEHYLVLGNSSGRQLFYPLGTQHAQGTTKTTQLSISDVNLDNKPDILLVKHSVPAFGAQVWQLEVITVNQGRWQSLLELPITILDAHGDIAPTLARFVEFDGDRLRIESMEYQSCAGAATRQNESCLNFRVETLRWNAGKQQFTTWYPVAITAVRATSIVPALLRERPQASAPVKAQIQTGTQLNIEATTEEYYVNKGKKSRTTWYRVRDEQNRTGYVEGQMLNFGNMMHSKVLDIWHTGAALTVFDFEPLVNFLQIRS